MPLVGQMLTLPVQLGVLAACSNNRLKTVILLESQLHPQFQILTGQQIIYFYLHYTLPL
jgi:hypothetical protein